MKPSRKYFIIAFSIVAFFAVCYGLFSYATNRPEYLASRADLIPKFFGISSSAIGSDDPDFCLDEIHSQGRDFNDFGSAGYSFIITPGPNGVFSDDLYRHPNSSINDSTLIISVRRGNINGTLTLEFDTGQAYVIYEQVY